MRAREDVGKVNPERPMITQKNYEDTLTAARKRMAELKAVGSRPSASDWPQAVSQKPLTLRPKKPEFKFIMIHSSQQSDGAATPLKSKFLSVTVSFSI